jgi:hypothetical protein
MHARSVVRAVVIVALAGAPARAQSVDVAAQIKLIEAQPGDLDRSTWKDKRREAARKLAQSKDRRAVPVLIKLAETETFDIIGEIAIEGLGALGDPAAAPTLHKIIADPARDKPQRELARKALARLGVEPAAPTRPTASPGGTPPARAAPASGAAPPAPADPGPGRPAPAAGPGSDTTRGLLGAAAIELPALPPVADDALAAYERVTFAGGTANVGYDTARKRAALDADVAGRYQRRVERDAMAWGVNVGAHLVAGYINPPGPAVSRGLLADLSGDGEARVYSGRIYGVGRAAAGAQLSYVSDVDGNNPSNSLKDTRFIADLQLAVGGGYGRVLDVGAAIRVRRLARTLDAARALGKPIDAATARRLQLAWWALRGERSSYRALVSTVAILREAGALLDEPDAGLSYELLNVLRDSQLSLRPSGLDAQLVFSEGYLQRPDQPAMLEAGRVEQLVASASYGAQLDDDKLELSGGGHARLRLFAADGQPAPWAAGVTARVRRFTYGDHGDPIGALDLSGELQIADDDLMAGQANQLGQRISAQLGFTWWLNAASGFRLAASVTEDRGVVFFGAELRATYGWLDATFSR